VYVCICDIYVYDVYVCLYVYDVYVYVCVYDIYVYDVYVYVYDVYVMCNVYVCKTTMKKGNMNLIENKCGNSIWNSLEGEKGRAEIMPLHYKLKEIKEFF